MDTDTLLLTGRYLLSAVMFLFLIRNTFKMRQITLFIENFNEKMNQYSPKKFPLTASKIEDYETDEEKDDEEPKKVGFFVPIEELINGFGFRFSPETFGRAVGSETFRYSVYLGILVQIVGAVLIAHFIFSIPLDFVALCVSGLIFLLLLI